MRPTPGYGYRDTVFTKEQPKIVKLEDPLFYPAYEFFPKDEEDAGIRGSLCMNDHYTLSFVQGGLPGHRKYFVAENACIVGDPDYPLGFFVPFTISPRGIDNLINFLKWYKEDEEGDSDSGPGEFFEYEDFFRYKEDKNK